MAVTCSTAPLGPTWLESGHGVLHRQPASSHTGTPAHRRPPVRAQERLKRRPAERRRRERLPGVPLLEEYAQWHLALTDGAGDETKARYAFVYGDFRRLHRMGLIACQYRAAEWRHKEVELAAHDLLQYLDKRSG
jgi:hypothetical protein